MMRAYGYVSDWVTECICECAIVSEDVSVCTQVCVNDMLWGWPGAPLAAFAKGGGSREGMVPAVLRPCA